MPTYSRQTLTLILCTMWASPALGHRPALQDGAWSTPKDAYVVQDIELSQVVYHRATCDARRLWFRIPAKAGDALFVQLGVPVLERLAHRPFALALLGPGLPPVALPFAAPASTGRTWPAATPQEGTLFDEPFSSTQSWILLEQTVTLPETGDYWLAAWPADGRTAKLWLSVGTVEKFDAEAMLEVIPLLDEVRRFHETLAEAPSEPRADVPCPAEVTPSGAVDADDGATPPTGCAAAAPPNDPLPWLLLTLCMLAVTTVRRRA